MRIVLVLFGHLRSYRSTHSSFHQFINTLQQAGNVDVFCHTWDIEESVTAAWWKEHKPGDIPSATVNANELEEKYKPVRYVIEPTRQFDDSGINIKYPVPVAGILSMLYSQQQAFQLLEQYSSENNITYDVVIKSRYDLLYEIAPSFSITLRDCITNNCLYLPTSNPYELAGSFSDVLAIGPASLMKEYFKFYQDFPEAVQYYQQSGYNRFLPELCLTTYLRKKSIDIKELASLRIHILRINGEKLQINSVQHFETNNPLCFFRGSIQKNKELVSEQRNDLADNAVRLVKKYMCWVDTDADEKTLRDYADFYNGKWIGKSKIKRLAAKGKSSKVFVPNIMKNFFEEAMRNANYGSVKMFLLAFILYWNSNYGVFFFRVWGNIQRKNK